MISNIHSERYADYLAMMRERDMGIEAAFRAHIREKYGDIKLLQVASAKELPNHVNCRCSIVWGKEGTEEATGNE